MTVHDQGLHISDRKDGYAYPARSFSREIDDFSHHPTHMKSVFRLMATTVEDYNNSFILNRLLSDRGRMIVSLYVCYVSAKMRMSNEHATLRDIQWFCRQAKLCSPGRAAALIALMKFGGYVVSLPSYDDKRKRHIVPTDRLLLQHRRRWKQNYEAMLPTFANAERVLAHLELDRFQDALLIELGDHYIAGFRILDYAPSLAEIVEANAGLLILAEIILQKYKDDNDDEFISISISDIARKFLISRAHVRDVLALAESADLIRQPLRYSGIILKPGLLTAVSRFYGALFVLFDQCGARALDIFEQRQSLLASSHPQRLSGVPQTGAELADRA